MAGPLVALPPPLARAGALARPALSARADRRPALPARAPLAAAGLARRRQSATRHRGTACASLGAAEGEHTAPRQSTRTVTSTYTAARMDGDLCRVFGPGSGGPEAGTLGQVVAVDEFFEAPSMDAAALALGAGLGECLVYYCGDVAGGEGHGLQVAMQSAMTFVDGAPGAAMPVISHLRDASQAEDVRVEGALVRVVAGRCAGTQAPPPFDGFTMLDVEMRPGEEAFIPLPAGEGAIVYILEGVGLFGDGREAQRSVAYQNEGHCLWLAAPPAEVLSRGLGGGGGGEATGLRVRTHPWSEIRFVLLSGGFVKP